MAVFEDALKFFDARGWWDGKTSPWHSTLSCTCLWLSVAEGGGVNAGTSLGHRVQMILGEVTGTDGSLVALYNWNDTRTNRQQVRQALIQAAAIEAERGDLRAPNYVS